jgi:[protein-PII] uridylyltransferase
VRLSPDVQLVDGELRLGAAAASEPGAALRAAATAADHAAALDRETLDRLAAAPSVLPEPWTEETRADFVALLRSGRPAIAVIEALDHHGIWTRIVPEWADVRARPQRNAYHRFTVDRHLLEAAANAARLAHRVERPDLLVTAALLHDLGKRGEGDHTDVGVVLAERITSRMGWSPTEAETIVALVRHHLLLADVATRRDLEDAATIERVVDAIATPERVHLLAALTEADAVATGPAAWSAWKAELVALLVDRVDHVLAKGEHAPHGSDRFPTPAQLEQLADGGRHIDASGDRITVMTDDRPGTFSKVAGVLALHGLDVVSAAAHSTDSGRALSDFRVAKVPTDDRGGWSRVVRDLELALDGRLALSARVADRAATYRRRHRATAHEPSVAFDNEASGSATIIDVHAADGVGVLYRITRALAELDLDIRSAKAETRGAVVTDAFYVRDGRGAKISDASTLSEITRAVIHGLGS